MGLEGRAVNSPPSSSLGSEFTSREAGTSAPSRTCSGFATIPKEFGLQAQTGILSGKADRYDCAEMTALLVGDEIMAKGDRRTARKPATKYPNLRKKLQKAKVRATATKRK